MVLVETVGQVKVNRLLAVLAPVWTQCQHCLLGVQLGWIPSRKGPYRLLWIKTVNR